jgi:hypothetical protein
MKGCPQCGKWIASIESLAGTPGDDSGSTKDQADCGVDMCPYCDVELVEVDTDTGEFLGGGDG